VVQFATVEADPVDARDPQAFEAVARREARRLFGIAYTILRDPAEAEDAVQDVMVRAWRAWHRTDGFGDQVHGSPGSVSIAASATASGCASVTAARRSWTRRRG
jgi:hypothetical protein